LELVSLLKFVGPQLEIQEQMFDQLMEDLKRAKSNTAPASSNFPMCIVAFK